MSRKIFDNYWARKQEEEYNPQPSFQNQKNQQYKNYEYKSAEQAHQEIQAGLKKGSNPRKFLNNISNPTDHIQHSNPPPGGIQMLLLPETPIDMNSDDKYGY